MNATDVRLWTSALAKIEAGAIDRLTGAEREIVLRYGNASMLQPRPQVTTATKQQGGSLYRADLDGKLIYVDLGRLER